MASLISRLPERELQRVARFGIVGLSGTLLDFGMLIALKNLGLPTLLAAALSYSGGILNNFTWNARWTYADQGQAQPGNQLWKFTLISLGGLGINQLALLALEPLFGKLFMDHSTAYLPAKIIGTGVVMVWNYLGNRLWTFRVRPTVD